MKASTFWSREALTRFPFSTSERCEPVTPTSDAKSCASLSASASAARNRLRRVSRSRTLGETVLPETVMTANLFAAVVSAMAREQKVLPKAQKAARQRVETIGDRVAQARRLLGVTKMMDILPSDLARLIDVPPSTITRLEKGERQPSEDLVLKLATALNVSPAWLRYGAPTTPLIPVNAPVSAKGASDEKE